MSEPITLISGADQQRTFYRFISASYERIRQAVNDTPSQLAHRAALASAFALPVEGQAYTSTPNDFGP
jgi:hypothetical protein